WRILMPIKPTQPSPPLLTLQQLPPRRRVGILVVVALLSLALLTIGGSIIGQHFLNTETIPVAPDNSPPGSFVQPPLNNIQIDALRHLVSHMQYKQLASLYVSRMSLDEELGQLIMVEYGSTSYSADLDTMINKLHAGGVIMYEFQMTTQNQTSHDIAQMQQSAKIPLLISADEEGG